MPDRRTDVTYSTRHNRCLIFCRLFCTTIATQVRAPSWPVFAKAAVYEQLRLQE